MTAREAVARANDINHQDSNRPIVRKGLRDASAKDLLEFIHELWEGWNERHMHAARAALDVRLAEDATKQSATLQQQVGTLVGIADAQRELAIKLDIQTARLVCLNRWLVILTVWLAVLTVVLCIFETLHFIEARKIAGRPAQRPQQTRQHHQQEGQANAKPYQGVVYDT